MSPLTFATFSLLYHEAFLLLLVRQYYICEQTAQIVQVDFFESEVIDLKILLHHKLVEVAFVVVQVVDYKNAIKYAKL